MRFIPSALRGWTYLYASTITIQSAFAFRLVLPGQESISTRLFRHRIYGVEQMTGFEPALSEWRSEVLPITPHLHTAPFAVFLVECGYLAHTEQEASKHIVFV